MYARATALEHRALSPRLFHRPGGFHAFDRLLVRWHGAFRYQKVWAQLWVLVCTVEFNAR